MSHTYHDVKPPHSVEAPAGFALYRTETSLDSLEIFLSTSLKHTLDEEKRARKIAREEARRIEQERLAAGGRRSAKEPESEKADAGGNAEMIAAFEAGVAQRDRRRRHQVLRGSELARVAAQIQTMRDNDYQKRDLQLVERLKGMGALRDVSNPQFEPGRWAVCLRELHHAYPHFRRVTDFVARCVT